MDFPFLLVRSGSPTLVGHEVNGFVNMSRTVRETNLETRAARLRLTAQGKPYWRTIESGLHVGYRRVKEGGGSWVARRFIGEGRYSETKLGVADDLQDADGISVHSFRQGAGLVEG